MSQQQRLTKQIRVTEETLEKIARKRIGWETPDECINRVFTAYCNPENLDSKDENYASQ